MYLNTAQLRNQAIYNMSYIYIHHVKLYIICLQFYVRTEKKYNIIPKCYIVYANSMESISV